MADTEERVSTHYDVLEAAECGATRIGIPHHLTATLEAAKMAEQRANVDVWRVTRVTIVKRTRIAAWRDGLQIDLKPE